MLNHQEGSIGRPEIKRRANQLYSRRAAEHGKDIWHE
jgi:hypothetical protein